MYTVIILEFGCLAAIYLMPLNAIDHDKKEDGYNTRISLREVITVHQLQSNIATAFHGTFSHDKGAYFT
jgi:hypothetical protein